MKRYKRLLEKPRILTFDDLKYYALHGDMPLNIKSLEEPVVKSEIELHPDEDEKESGLYKKPHRKWNGLVITIENPKGTVRSGVSDNGVEWKTKMNNDYGYIEGTKGKDKDHIDCFIGNNLDSQEVFIINQVNPSTGVFDEHKCMIGFDSPYGASKAYLSNYEKGWKGLGNIVRYSLDEFKDFLFNGQVKDKA